MRVPFANYDAWLEAPYQEMYAEDDRFVEWAEEMGFDLSNTVNIEAAEAAYEEWLDEIQENMFDDEPYGDYADRLDWEVHENEDYFSDSW